MPWETIAYFAGLVFVFGANYAAVKGEVSSLRRDFEKWENRVFEQLMKGK